MTWNELSELVTAGAACVGVAIGGFGLWQVRVSARTRRAEWLASLHEGFFGGDRFDKVRDILDYRMEPQLRELTRDVVSGACSELSSSWYAYLNYFEFVGGLKKLRQLSDEEIDGLFGYYLSDLRKHEFIVRLLTSESFELLADLLARWRLKADAS